MIYPRPQTCAIFALVAVENYEQYERQFAYHFIGNKAGTLFSQKMSLILLAFESFS